MALEAAPFPALAPPSPTAISNRRPRACSRSRAWTPGACGGGPAFFKSIFHDYRRSTALEGFNSATRQQQPIIKLPGVGSLGLLSRKGRVCRWWHRSLAEGRQLLWGQAVALQVAHLGTPCDQVSTTLRRVHPVDFNWFTLYPCAFSFFQRLCSDPFPPVSCSFPEPHPDPQGCLYNLLERQPENSWPWEGNTV